MTDHSDSPFLNAEITKRSGASLKALVAPYKGGTQKTRSSLPLQARKATARIARKRGTTKTPFGRPS